MTMPETVRACGGVELPGGEKGVDLKAEGDGVLDLIWDDARRCIGVWRRLRLW